MRSGTGYSRSPRLQTGALIQLNRAIIGILPSVTLFQYNPESINRNFSFQQSRSSEESPGLEERTHEAFAPGESYSFKLELDATDDLEQGRQFTETVGIADRLAVLERLIYPPRGPLAGIADSLIDLVGVGPLKRASNQTIPIVLLALGRRRVIPVWITSLSITESAHNPAMMPIHAEVDLAFDVIQPHELPKRNLTSPPQLDVELAKATYALYRFERDALAIAHLATVVSDFRS